MRIGIVTAKFNSEITLKLEQGALEELKRSGLAENQIWSVRVPGAVEIPIVAQALLHKGCDAVIALGAVIRGETAHFDYVCQSVERGVTHLMLETGKPVIFGVLTTENEEQALARTQGPHGNKGQEAAMAALEMLQTLKQIRRGFKKAKASTVGKKSQLKGTSSSKSKKKKATSKT